jgi:dUTP pyrophosphatase|tara:strand:- start:3586 stop:4032 length:447 start_codon:yes stop_codon:yes gene_type:complete
MAISAEVGGIEVQRLKQNATIPTKANLTDAGFDLYVCTEKEIILNPKESKLIPTGIAMALPRNHAGLIWDRSSMGVKGIHRFAGVVDSGYRGEIKVCLYNSNDRPYTINSGDRIAQILIQKVDNFYLREVVDLNETDRGSGGFGSSGK